MNNRAQRYCGGKYRVHQIANRYRVLIINKINIRFILNYEIYLELCKNARW